MQRLSQLTAGSSETKGLAGLLVDFIFQCPYEHRRRDQAAKTEPMFVNFLSK